MDDYADFLARKTERAATYGFEVGALGAFLYPFQERIVRWALQRGRAAVFAECGMGKTPMQLEWARQVAAHTGGKVLILAPLAVSQQTVREGAKFGLEVRYARSQAEATGAVTIANYEMLEHFTPSDFTGVVLDESSILKAYSGIRKRQILAAFRDTPYRLACTATRGNGGVDDGRAREQDVRGWRRRAGRRERPAAHRGRTARAQGAAGGGVA